MSNKNEKRLYLALAKAKKSEVLSTLDDKDLIWFFKKLFEKKRNLVEGLSESAFEIFLDFKLHKIESLITKSKSRDVKEATKKYFEWMSLEKTIGNLETRISSLKLGQHEEAKKLRKELDSFYKEARKVHPEFMERYADRISEIEGDLIAIYTDGEMGSTRKLIELERSGELKKYRQEMKRQIEESKKKQGKK